MKSPILIFLSLLVTLTFSGCLKKGDDDPLISLRSRKGRLEGEWKVTSTKYTNTYTSHDNATNKYTVVYTSDGRTYTLVSTNYGISTTRSGTETQEWEFEKDGKFTLSTVRGGALSTSKGRWNFTAGVGEVKNKSQIVLSLESTTDTGGQSTYTGNYIDGTYDILELRHKKIVLHSSLTEMDNAGFSSSEYEVELEEN